VGGSFCSWLNMTTTLWHIAMPGAGAIHTICFARESGLSGDIG